MSIFIAQEKGIFKKNGLDIEIINEENIGGLYSEKKLDVICTALTESILFSSEGQPTEIIYRFSYSYTNDIIIAKNKIKNLESLRGKIISFDGINSSSHVFVQELLRKKGIEEGEYFSVNLPVNLVMTELEKGNIDAGYAKGVTSLEIKKRNFHIIGKSSDDPDLVSDTLSVNLDFSKTHANEIGIIISSILEANELYRTNPEECISVLSQRFDKSKGEIEEELKGLKFLSLQENIQSLKIDNSEIKPFDQKEISMGGGNPHSQNMGIGNRNGGLFIAGETIIQFLIKRGQLYKLPVLKTIINDTYLKKQNIQ
jgi:NitT/TauT family transport system substrate-binding protein